MPLHRIPLRPQFTYGADGRASGSTALATPIGFYFEACWGFSDRFRNGFSEVHPPNMKTSLCFSNVRLILVVHSGGQGERANRRLCPWVLEWLVR